jgi:hypothetical protein
MGQVSRNYRATVGEEEGRGRGHRNAKHDAANAFILKQPVNNVKLPENAANRWAPLFDRIERFTRLWQMFGCAQASLHYAIRSAVTNRFTLLDNRNCAMASKPVYLEIVDFFDSGTAPQVVVDFQPSLAAQKRALELLELAKQDQLTSEQESAHS